ncbi:hypothetical protein Ato02nite_097840 [Paractinoplanes toevensis]|uniref:Uncharacterized protein n=1 Tax=Paractinoplanes toevensis TaxID=571911 RepID=A0A919WD82_9ACTN|nr:hypothetical protein Ato02nite_097840 [Actinoplanes toevensis]
MHPTGQRLHVERLCVVPVDPVPHPAQQRKLLEPRVSSASHALQPALSAVPLPSPFAPLADLSGYV